MIKSGSMSDSFGQPTTYVKSKAIQASSELPPFYERLIVYLAPLQLIFYGVIYLLQTLVRYPLLPLNDFQAFRHKAFAALWNRFGQAMSEQMPEGTVEVVSKASGVVLDVGPGTGTQLHLFDPSKISTIYGVEPAVDMHAGLRSAVQKHGFEGKYEIVNAGAEPDSLVPALEKVGLLTYASVTSGVFDTIICIRALCGVPHPYETVEELYRLLKPGGRLIVVEHVRNSWPNGGRLGGALSQRLHMALGWEFWLAGCCLDRDTESVIRRVAGPDGWRETNVTVREAWTPFPKLVGGFVKR